MVFPKGGWGLEAGVVWAWTVAAAWADCRDAHPRALVVGTVVGAGGLLALAAAPVSVGLAVVAATVMACVGFDVAQVFTGSLLSRIAGERGTNGLSAAGFAAGYAGGAIALVLATATVAAHDRFGLDVAGGLRLAFAATAAWWLAFSIPGAIVRFGSGDGARHAPDPGSELVDFARRLVGRADGDVAPQFASVICGSMLALGGVQTAIAQFSSIALQEFDLDGPALVRIVPLVQLVALPGAIAVGWWLVRRLS